MTGKTPMSEPDIDWEQLERDIKSMTLPELRRLREMLEAQRELLRHRERGDPEH